MHDKSEMETRGGGAEDDQSYKALAVYLERFTSASSQLRDSHFLWCELSSNGW